MPNVDRIIEAMAPAYPGKDEITVTLTKDALRLTGWKSARIMRSIEVATSSFVLTCSADATTLKLLAREGAPIKIQIGDDTIMCGYVETVESVMTSRSHDITISGRGKLADIVDASCNVDQIHPNTKFVALCESVLRNYGIKTFMPPNGTEKALAKIPVLPRRLISITETAWEVIEQYARYCGVLVFESEEGELTISLAGTELGGSGVSLGENIEAISCTKSTLGTFSSYNAVLTPYSNGAEDENIPNLPVVTVVASGHAANPERYRPTYFVSETSSIDPTFIERRVNWMASRAYGRSRRVRVLVDSWREASGSPWIPNVNYPVSADAVGIPDQTILLLVSATFILDQNGTHAELLFGPRQGYLPEPVLLDGLPMDEVTNQPKPR